MASKVVSGIGNLADIHTNVVNQIELQRVTEIAETITDFDQIALRVSVNLTLANQEQIKALNGALVDKDWKTHSKAALSGAYDSGISGAVESALTSFMEDSKTQAKLMGRVEAHKVITYLKQESVAESLKYEDEKDVGKPTYKTRHSVIGEAIAREIRKSGQEIPKESDKVAVANIKQNEQQPSNSITNQQARSRAVVSDKTAKCCAIM